MSLFLINPPLNLDVLPARIVTGATSLQAYDRNGVRSTAGSNFNFTVLANILAANEVVNFLQAGAGQITLVAGAGVTLNTRVGRVPKTLGQYAEIVLIHEGGNVFTVGGWGLATS